MSEQANQPKRRGAPLGNQRRKGHKTLVNGGVKTLVTFRDQAQADKYKALGGVKWLRETLDGIPDIPTTE